MHNFKYTLCYKLFAFNYNYISLFMAIFTTSSKQHFRAFIYSCGTKTKHELHAVIALRLCPYLLDDEHVACKTRSELKIPKHKQTIIRNGLCVNSNCL